MNQALNIDQNISTLWDNKGYALHQLGKYDEAIKCYNRSLSLNPVNTTTIKNKEDAIRGIRIK